MRLIELTKELIEIPSYVDDDNNETKIGNYLLKLILDELPDLSIERQFIDKNRFNIIAMPKNNKPDVIFLSHIDTVLPTGSTKDKCTPFIKDGNIYGLGSCDMKGGLAAAIIAVKESEKNNAGLIIDCDEEYYFAGVKKLISKYLFSPKLLICPEPTNLKVVNGCRGVVELRFRIIGRTAHAGSPEKGINAIEKTVELVQILRRRLCLKDNPKLGKTTINLSYIRGGRKREDDITIQANAVPDIAEVLLDIRTASEVLSASRIYSELEKISKTLNVFVYDKKINLDYNSYYIEEESLNKICKVSWDFEPDIGKGGFFESAIVYKKWKCPCINFGPIGPAHDENEYVTIESLAKTKDIFVDIINKI